jgi:hypothetical protein
MRSYLIGVKKMKINQKILSIPPYISTTWKNISALQAEVRPTGIALIITLINGKQVEIIGLDPGVIKAVFAAHVNAVELEATSFPSAMASSQDHALSLGMPLKSDMLNALDKAGPLLQHNPERFDDPDLPPSFVEKICFLSKTLGIRDSAILPEPEPHCNCLHCQIAKALRSGLEERQEHEEHLEEEIVSDEDLKFRIWDIDKTGDKLYFVSNPLETQEHYSVFLGEPVGCTCGNPHCEHIRAVLNS